MRKSSKKASVTLPASFSTYVLAGEALCYPLGSTHIAPAGSALFVQVDTKAIDSGVIEAWFIRSIHPLVGKKAADALEKLIRANPGEFKEFLEEAIKFRLSLK